MARATWSIVCEEQVCPASLTRSAEGPSELAADLAARALCRADALLRGWEIATDVAVPGKDEDRCPNHRRDHRR